MSTPDDARPDPGSDDPPTVPDAGPPPPASESPAPVPAEPAVLTSEPPRVSPSAPPPPGAVHPGDPKAPRPVGPPPTPPQSAAPPAPVPPAPVRPGPAPAWGAPPPGSVLGPTPGYPPPGYPAAPPPSSSVYPVQSGGYGARPGPVPDPGVRQQRSVWVTVVAAAVTALLVSAGTSLALDRLADDSATSKSTPRPASVATIGQSTVEGVPVEGSSVSQPDWERVAATVTSSVVAIETSDASGSGVLFSPEGDIITNNHVVADAEDGTVRVMLADGRVYSADIVGTDPTTDLAVVRLDSPPDDLSPAALGDSSTVRVGQPVMAVGSPMGLQNTATTGVVSALNRPMGPDGMPELVTNTIQVDASVNPGNSGGPLFDGEGKVIGINASIITFVQSGGQGGSIGLGFAIPVNLVKNIASQLVNNPDHVARHAYLGVLLNSITTEADGVTRTGAKVVRVETGTPAAEVGLVEGDVIVAFNDEPVQSREALTAFVRSYSAGDEVTLTIVRDGQALTVDVTLTSRPDEEIAQPTPEPP
ncbi:MAG: trypsin-like peptidase domain-containing protein [Micrococcales bacterium]|nr:trypsin-like peptidase domain-containing protein [Micrococcales bacterium]